MRTQFTILCLILIAFGTSGASNNYPKDTERQAKRIEMIKRTGGLIKIPQNGFVAMIDCQSRADFNRMSKKFMETFEGFGFAAIPSRSDKPFSLEDLSTGCKKLGAGSVIYIVDESSLPMSLVSIETRSGLVNVSALAVDNPTSALLTRRTCKMIGRVAMLASGGAESLSPTSDLQPVTTLQELDMNEGQGDEVYVMMGVINGMAKAGVSAERRMTYRQACKVGLAPAPTNDIQKAIWEEFKEQHGHPFSSPMKIKE